MDLFALTKAVNDRKFRNGVAMTKVEHESFHMASSVTNENMGRSGT